MPRYDYRIIAEFCKTHTLQEAQREFGCSRSIAQSAVDLYRITPPTVVSKRYEEIANWVKKNKATIAEAQVELKCSHATVVRACLQFNVNPRKAEKGKISSASTFAVLERLLAGESQSEIQQALGVSRQRIQWVLSSAKRAKIIGKGSRLVIKVK